MNDWNLLPYAGPEDRYCIVSGIARIEVYGVDGSWTAALLPAGGGGVIVRRERLESRTEAQVEGLKLARTHLMSAAAQCTEIARRMQ